MTGDRPDEQTVVATAVRQVAVRHCTDSPANDGLNDRG